MVKKRKRKDPPPSMLNMITANGEVNMSLMSPRSAAAADLLLGLADHSPMSLHVAHGEESGDFYAAPGNLHAASGDIRFESGDIRVASGLADTPFGSVGAGNP